MKNKINNEIPEWILEKLCIYDKRNPMNVTDQVDIEDIPPGVTCWCDNCFCGRTQLANEIIKRHEQRTI